MSGAGALLTGSEDAKIQDSGMSGRIKIKAAELSRHQLISGAGVELAAPAPPVLAPELMQVWKILSALSCLLCLPGGGGGWCVGLLISPGSCLGVWAWCNACGLASSRVWPCHL